MASTVFSTGTVITAPWLNDVNTKTYSDTSNTVAYTPAGTGAVATTVQAKLRQYVSVIDFGAKGDGTTDDTTAIQNALNTGNPVYMPPGSYPISNTLRMAVYGQILYGAGMGESTVVYRTQLKWVGASGGTMISFWNGSTVSPLVYSECSVRDMYINGNSLANRGIEIYKEGLTGGGGSWRALIFRVGISGVSGGANSTAIYAGAGTSNDNANDFIISACYLYGSAYGIQSGGAVCTLSNHTTIQGMTTAGISATAGSFWSLGDAVFSTNAWDILATNTQGISASGAWFENSTSGVLQATTAIGSFSLSGCLLQTFNATRLIDMQSAAGTFSLKGCFVNGTSTSTLIKNPNPNYDYDVLTTNCTIDTGYKQWAHGSVRADNCGFSVAQTSDATNATGDGTTYSMNAAAVTKQYDLASAVNASTGVFTAPLFGYYEFDVQVSLGNLAVAHTDFQLNLFTTTQTYLLGQRLSPGAVRTPSNEEIFSGRVRCYMAAGDTAYPTVYVSGSTKTVTVQNGSVATLWRTRFQGRMV